MEGTTRKNEGLIHKKVDYKGFIDVRDH